MAPRKRKRNHPSLGRLGDLPNSIIHHILSFVTVRDAVKLCSLSRQWKSLWTSISTLSFRCGQQNASDFASFVRKALALYSAPKLRTFFLEFPCDSRFKNELQSGLHFAATHEVEELYLHFTKLYCVSVVFFDSKVLRVLSLARLRLEIQMVRSIFRGTPSMESLTLRDCVLIRDTGSSYLIDASSTSLKNLVIDSCFEVELRGNLVGCIEIKGPDLVSLTVNGFMEWTILKLADVSSLVEANIDFLLWSSPKRNVIKGILEKLLHVDRLEIGAWIYKLISTMSFDSEIFPQLRCKTLKLGIRWNQWYFYGIRCLLRSSPSLKLLIVKVMARQVRKKLTNEARPNNANKLKKVLEIKEELLQYPRASLDAVVVLEVENGPL